jgi:hypothetical protein
LVFKKNVEMMTNYLESVFMIKNVLIAFAFVLAFAGCNGESSSLYDPNFESERPDPVMSVIEPESGWLAGVEGVVIRGENFSENSEENRVYFDGIPGEILSSTSSEIRIRPAQTVGDAVEVKVTVREAINFSNSLDYVLDQAVFPAPGSISNDNVLAVATDAAGDIYFSYQEGGVPRGLRRWDTENETVAQHIPSRIDWTSLKVGPDGLLYRVRRPAGHRAAGQSWGPRAGAAGPAGVSVCVGAAAVPGGLCKGLQRPMMG